MLNPVKKETLISLSIYHTVLSYCFMWLVHFWIWMTVKLQVLNNSAISQTIKYKNPYDSGIDEFQLVYFQAYGPMIFKDLKILLMSYVGLQFVR